MLCNLCYFNFQDWHCTGEARESVSKMSPEGESVQSPCHPGWDRYDKPAVFSCNICFIVHSKSENSDITTKKEWYVDTHVSFRTNLFAAAINQCQ